MALSVCLLFGLFTGCRSGIDANDKHRLFIFAASSLTDAFQELERDFERAHPDLDVVLNLAGSQILRVQIERGAPADVFASANEDHMTRLVNAGRVQTPRSFAHNRLVVVVPESNPAGLKNFEALSQTERVVLGTENVPIGLYTRQMLALATSRYGASFLQDTLTHVVSEESNVRLILAKVKLGEANAAVVYRTDALSTRDVHLIEIPSDLNVTATYTQGLVEDGKNPEAAREWMRYVQSPEGERVLARHGFEID